MIILVGYQKHPHEVALLLVCLLSGIAGLIAPAHASSSLLGQLPELWLYAWNVVLIVGSALAVAGVFTQGMVGHLVERAGLFVLLTVLTGYGVALFGIAGLRATFFALMCLGVAGANYVRIRQINRDLKEVHDEAVELEE